MNVNMNMDFNRNDFPEGFTFGTATSAYQIEGHGSGGAGPTHWDTFAATPGNVTRNENGARACDHYHRYQQDLDLIAQAGFDAYRFSTSWARVMPDGVGRVNQQGLDFYDALVDAMLERNIAPFATLYHWELPAALADLGGWRNPDISNWFADFTEVVMRRIGDRVVAAAPINEPWCVAWLSHFLGHHAPGMQDIRAAARAMHHVLVAHGKSIAVMRDLGMKNLGIVVNFEYAQAADDESQHAAQLYDGIYNRWFLDAVFKKSYPMDVVQHLQAHLPDGWEEDFETIAAPVDWIGINYYTRKIVTTGCSGLALDFAEKQGNLAKTTMDWEIFPAGLGHFLQRVHADYATGLPIYVTENGMSNHDTVIDGEIADRQRIDYINAHMAQVLAALDQGIDVAGYFVWSLLDNYEWSLGYDKRFGLVHVDFETLQRTPKASYHALRSAISR